MMRDAAPTGLLNYQMRVLGKCAALRDDGNADTTKCEFGCGLRTCQIYLQAVSASWVNQRPPVRYVTFRNITGDPAAGLDADELFDTRELVQQVQDMITNRKQQEFTKK